MISELTEQEIEVLKVNLPPLLANYKAILSVLRPTTLASSEALDLMGWSIKELILKYDILSPEELNKTLGVGTTRARVG